MRANPTDIIKRKPSESVALTAPRKIRKGVYGHGFGEGEQEEEEDIGVLEEERMEVDTHQV